MNEELASLFNEDKQERIHQPKVNTPEYQAMSARDLQRRERVMAIAAANGLQTAEDLRDALEILEGLGWVRRFAIKPTGGGRSSERLHLHPDLRD